MQTLQTFAEFMQQALYAPGTGYYRHSRLNPFGQRGDFYTAVQLEPVFGEVLEVYLESLELSQVVDLGAGRAGLAEALSAWNYIPVDWDLHPLPARIDGVVIANEFFDALPVHLLAKGAEGWHELCVAGERFVPRAINDARLTSYAERYGEPIPEGGRLEVNLAIADWVMRIAQALSGRLLVIDYGYSQRELIRFPEGTLMSYRRHIATGDVLAHAGSSDITAHVNFTELKRLASEAGLRLVEESSLATWVLKVFGPVRLAERWFATDDHWRLQWKQLVFGMGEVFRVLEFTK